MNINTDTIVKILLILLSVIIIIYYDKLFPNFNVKNTAQLEAFLTVNDFLDKNNIKEGTKRTPELHTYDKTIYETSIINHSLLKNNPELVCNLLPILDCPDRKKFPVQMIKLINGHYAAVFNDGKLYSSDNYKENIWIGPYDNSMPNRYIPLRMINTTPHGNMIVGVGYDNRCYIKRSEKLLDLTAEWQLMEDIPSTVKVIYLMYYFDKVAGKSRKMIINNNGIIMIQEDSGSFRSINNTKKLLKVFYDRNGFLLGLDTNFHLGTFDDKNWEVSEYAAKSPVNTYNLINDIIYDNDNKLVAISFNFDKDILDYKKQTGVGYDQKFVILDKNEEIKQNMTDYQIIISKLGMGEMLGLYDERDKASPLDNDVEMAYQRQILADNAELRKFCANRQDNLDTDFIDIELSNQVSINNQKLKKINNLLNDLVNG